MRQVFLDWDYNVIYRLRYLMNKELEFKLISVVD